MKTPESIKEVQDLIGSLRIVKSFEVPYSDFQGNDIKDKPPRIKQYFEPLYLKKGEQSITLSMQASEVQNYCTPTASLPSLIMYESVEVAILDESLEGGQAYLSASAGGLSGIRVRQGDVGANVPVQDILQCVLKFFSSGGVVDMTRGERGENV